MSSVSCLWPVTRCWTFVLWFVFMLLCMRVWHAFRESEPQLLSLQRDVYSALKWKMPLTSASETNALFWLRHDKSCSPSKLLLRLFKFFRNCSAFGCTAEDWLSSRWFMQFLSLWILIDGFLCEVIISTLLSHPIYCWSPAWINDFSLDTRFIQRSVKQHFS